MTLCEAWTHGDSQRGADDKITTKTVIIIVLIVIMVIAMLEATAVVVVVVADAHNCFAGLTATMVRRVRQLLQL